MMPLSCSCEKTTDGRKYLNEKCAVHGTLEPKARTRLFQEEDELEWVRKGALRNGGVSDWLT